MNKRRLLKLADLLEADSKNKTGIKFDLACWGTTEDDSSVSHSCGTTACAVGLAIVSGAFERSGLSNLYGPESRRIVPHYNGESHWAATMSFFGVDMPSAEFLFADHRYPHEKTKGAVGERFVAKRIRDFVAGKVEA